MAKGISKTLKWTGRGLGAYGAYQINQQYANGNIGTVQMVMEQAVNAASTEGGIHGAAIGFGWEMGRAISETSWYQNFKENYLYPARLITLGY